MYPTFLSKDDATEFHSRHYPHMKKIDKSGKWTSAECPNDHTRYCVRLYNEETLNLTMYSVASASKARCTQ